MNASKISALSGLVMMLATGYAAAAAPTPLTVTGSTITFNGEVTSGACGISVGSKNQEITLATVPVASIVKSATPTKLTAFTITLEGCSTDTYTTASFDFNGQTPNGTETNVLKNTATQNVAGGVGVQLLDSNSKPIVINSTGQGAKMTLAAGSSNTASFSAGIYGLAAGGVTSGTVLATTNFNIRYE
ncbi:fimbrial protein [Hafnia alvei]|uniref:Fimbrial-type adhesion domain-containing protein n=1 Tax=Hafnia alvei FB1 TaxID=1453496 RepID=A0A097R3Y8_HAFAL|nr:fimbrial protein [Hafnia alvei]AIU73430.1 hypothetical protein AT03_14225 [Hafnia alvei FB1]KID06032.2 hypothetical protein PU01_02415 [Hafnia alvei]MBW3477248.1 fimbrial protein [Hafnia alvei]